MKTLEELIKEIEKEFIASYEKSSLYNCPDCCQGCWDNCKEDLKKELRKVIYRVIEETLKIDKKKIKEIMKITKEGK